MLTSARNVEDLVEALEVRFLANRDAHLHFGLLTDFPDAREESLPADEPLLATGPDEDRRAESEIRACRAPVRTESGKADDGDAGHFANASVFYLFHRPRRWNAEARLWMGHERKRGKLGDLNSLLRGGHPRRFLSHRRCDRRPVASEVRHYAGHGHATAARRGATVCRRDGAPAECRPLRRTRKGHEQGGGHVRSRHPPAAGVRRACPARTGRVTHACTAVSRASTSTRARFRRLSGRLRRRLVHR